MSMKQNKNIPRLTLTPGVTKAVRLWADVNGPALGNQTSPGRCLAILRAIHDNMDEDLFASFQSLGRSLQTPHKEKTQIRDCLDRCTDVDEFTDFIERLIADEEEAIVLHKES